MNVRRYFIILTLLLLCVGVIYSQEKRTDMRVVFRVNITSIDSTYLDNAASLREIASFLDEIRQDNTIKIVEVSFFGAASPEGSYQLNRRLAHGRLAALEKFVRMKIEIPDSVIIRNDYYIPWNYLKRHIEESELPQKEKIIAILDEEAQLVDYHHPNMHVDKRIVKLKEMDGGKVWQQMSHLYFEDMRSAYAVFVTQKEEPTPIEVPDTVQIDSVQTVENIITEPDTIVVADTISPEVEEWHPKLYLKTNAIGLGLGIVNLGVEVDLVSHWSFSLPLYYSAWDYFTSTVKFRTLAIQPELRYWVSEENDGWFVGAHFGCAYYNVAINGDYRFQDYNRETPAIGGGLNVGYRLPISKNNRWRLAFSLGAGTYSLHYDKFHNTPKTKDGLKIESIKQTYWGIDQAAISFSYMFDLKKKGDKQ